MAYEEQTGAASQQSPGKQTDGIFKRMLCAVVAALWLGFEVIVRGCRWVLTCCVKGVRKVVGVYALQEQQERDANNQAGCHDRMEQTLERLERQLTWMERNGREEYLRLENHLLDALESHERQYAEAMKALQTHLDWQVKALTELEKALNALSQEQHQQHEELKDLSSVLDQALNTLSREQQKQHKDLVSHTYSLASQQQDRLKACGKSITGLESRLSELAVKQEATKTSLTKNLEMLVEAQRLLMVQSLLGQTSHAVDGLRKTK